MKVLITAPYVQEDIEQLRPILESKGLEIVLPPVKERMSEEELLPIISEYDGVISGDDQFTEKVLQTAKKLKVISKWGVGTDSIDKKAAAKLGIAVCNTAGAFKEQIANTVLGYILCFARKLVQMDRAMKKGIWKKVPLHSLDEMILGVIGVGNIGKAVIEKAHAFNMRIIGNDIVNIDADFLNRYQVEMLTKEQLLEEADFVSLNCDLNPTSYHLIGKKEFLKMKSSAVIINTARGPVIDETALVQALRTLTIAGAALDVFEKEPLPQDSPLRSFENCFLAPHNSNGGAAERKRVHESTINNLLKELKEERL